MRCFPLLSRGAFFAGGIVFLLAPSLNAEWASPEGFFEKEEIERKEVAPGIVWIAASGEREGKPLRTHLLAIDLKKSGVTLRNLLGARQFKADSRQRVARSTVSQLAKEGGALAAVNTAFFDIKGTQTSSGLLLHKGSVLREPGREQPSLLFLENGLLAIREAHWSAKVRLNGKEPSVATIAAVNSPYLPDGEFALYREPWQKTPGRDGFPTKEGENEPVTEIVFRGGEVSPGLLRGSVQQVRCDQPSVAIGAGEFVLAFKGKMPWTVKKGEEVTVESTLSFSAGGGGVEPLAALEGFSGKPWLVRNGVSGAGPSKSWRERHPRSAVGIDATGEQMLLVAVDGRSDASVGIDLATLADYFIHMECEEALNFDGGGSTALGAMVDGKWRVLNTPSDGRERFVPVGLGVVLPTADKRKIGAK